MSAVAGPIYSLTTDERTALSLSATGLAVAEVADVLGVSSDVVRERLGSAIRHLGARSKLEAVVIAARRGYYSATLDVRGRQKP